MPYIGKKPADIIATVIDTTTGTFSGEVDAGSLDVSGNADIDGITNLDNTDIDGTLNVQGETTLQTHLNMGDNDIIKLGDSADLQIYHNGSNSIIKDAGGGNLSFETNNTYIGMFTDGGETMFKASKNSGVELWYDNGKKLETTSTGIDVTGTVTADGLTVDGTADVDNLIIDNAGKISSVGQIEFQVDNDNNQSGTYFGFSRNNTTSERIALFQENGDISFYEDTGTTAKFFWDASAERLGIGTTSPGSNIEIEDTSSNVVLRMVSSATSQSAIYLGDANFRSRARLIYDNSDETFQIWGGSGTGSAQRITLDSSGNLLVGKTSSNLSTAGSEFASDGLVRFTRSNVNAVVNFNKLNNEGDIVVFRKDDALVGSIGVTSTDNVFLSGNSSHAGIMAGTSAIAPFKNGVLVDNGIDFGTNNYRWKDLYLSGGVYVGGTGSSNFLDDYEEGTWEPELKGSSSSPTVSYNGDTGGYYIKIGSMVYLTGTLRTTTVSGGSGTALIGGLPYAIPARSNGDNADGNGAVRCVIWDGTSTEHPTIVNMRNSSSNLNIMSGNNTGVTSTLQVSDWGNACMISFTCVIYTS